MRYKLDEVAEFQKGFAFKSKSFIDTGIKIVKVSNLTNDSIDPEGCVCIDYTIALGHTKYSLNKDDILITTVGSWPNNPASIVGKVVKVPKSMNGSLLNQNAVRVRSKNNFDQKYLFYLLKDIKFKDYIIGTAQGSANQASITQKDIKNFTHDFPCELQQRAIANILSTLDEKIEVNNQINKKLEEMAQAIFKQWFVDFEFPNEEGKPYKSSGGAMVESELGMIPKIWEVKDLEGISELNPRETLKKGQESYYVEMSNLPLNSARITNCIVKEYNGGTKFRNGDILFARITPCLENGKTAIVDFLNNEQVGFGSTEYIILRPYILNTYYLYFLARNNEFRNYAIKNMNGTSGRQRVNTEAIKKYKLVCPDAFQLICFEKLCAPLFVKMKHNDEQTNVLMEIRDTLLPKLMSREISVPIEQE